jgi:hypothetical protein
MHQLKDAIKMYVIVVALIYVLITLCDAPQSACKSARLHAGARRDVGMFRLDGIDETDFVY